MRIFWGVICVFIAQTVFAADPPYSDLLNIWLKNGTGIMEENGDVYLWENQVDNNCQAKQDDATLRGQVMYETYPGKVNVGFSKTNSHLKLENSNQFFRDQTFSIFYVGKVSDVKSLAPLFSNLKPSAGWKTYTGFRLMIDGKENITFQYGSPGYTKIPLSRATPNEFFYLGFTIDANGDYLYIDNQSEEAIFGSINGTLPQNDLDYLFNIQFTPSEQNTLDHTEVAEFLAYDKTFTADQMESMRTWLSEEYSAISQGEFSMLKFTPASSTELGEEEAISFTFTQKIKTPDTKTPDVYINKKLANDKCSWSTASSTLTLTPNSKWPKGSLVTVKIDPTIESAGGNPFSGTRNEYEFIVDTEEDFGVETITIPTIATRNNGTHNIPLQLVLPEKRENKVPVHFWIHGGGWSGGTTTESKIGASPHGEYLAKKLSVATLNVAYRCMGSSGTFTQAMEDIDAAYQWAVENAATYNLDIENSVFSGGSAGSPLASLAAQRYEKTKAFVGFNGIYNFVENPGSKFPSGSSYKYCSPTCEANSALLNLRDNPPITILMHGDADGTINHQQSVLFAQEINNMGGDATAVIYPDQPHAFFNKGWEQYEDVLFEMTSFLKEHGITQMQNTETFIGDNASSPIKPYSFSNAGNDGVIQIEFFKNSLFDVAVHNLSGAKVYEQLKNDTATIVNLQDQPGGVYLISLKTDTNQWNEKVIVR